MLIKIQLIYGVHFFYNLTNLLFNTSMYYYGDINIEVSNCSFVVLPKFSLSFVFFFMNFCFQAQKYSTYCDFLVNKQCPTNPWSQSLLLFFFVISRATLALSCFDVFAQQGISLFFFVLLNNPICLFFLWVFRLFMVFYHLYFIILSLSHICLMPLSIHQCI